MDPKEEALRAKIPSMINYLESTGEYRVIPSGSNDEIPHAKIPSVISFLENTGDYRVCSRFVPVDEYNGFLRPENGVGLKTLMVIDTETTGLDKTKDKIIEIGYLLVEFDPRSGLVFRVLDRVTEFEDPGFPIPEEITELTGITDKDVAGKAFNDEKIIEAASRADVVIAHNAGGVDRAFLEKRLPIFENKWWCCSMIEGPWKQLKIASTKQEFIAEVFARIFYSAHRAITDAEVLLHILSMVGPEEKTVLGFILETSRKPSYRVWATGSPFDKKDILKINHRYRWCDDGNPAKPQKVWYRDGVTDLEAELEMLRTEIYPRNKINQVIVDRMTGRERFSDRFQSKETIVLNPPVDASADLVGAPDADTPPVAQPESVNG